ncbi:lipopolysaccharide biosynthesis protein [Spirosoma montaniterrae]|nr:MATE family efflux transporter [Spirosoma montaniterrae]
MVTALKSKLTDFFVRGHERTVLVRRNIALSFLIRAGGILVGLVLVPMTINYVSPAQYGVWLTISSIVQWLNFFDVGLGNGLRNKLAHSLAIGEKEKARVYVSTTYAVLALIAILTFVVFAVSSSFVEWRSVLNVDAEKEETLRSVMWVAVGCFCIQFVVQLINVVLASTHQSAKASFIALFGQLSTLAAIYYCIHYVPSSLFALVAIVASMPVLAFIVSSLFLYRNVLASLAPNWQFIRFKHAGSLLNTGGIFFVIQISVLVIFQSNYVIINQLLGPEQVTIFSVCYKLFSVTIVVFNIIMLPLWSSFTDAYAKQDFNWLRNSLHQMRKLWLAFAALTILILVCSPLLFKLWIGESVSVPMSLSVCMAMYVIANLWHMLHVYLLNGIGKIRLQLILVIIGALLNIPIAIYFGKSFGIIGVVGTNTLFFLVLGVVYSLQCQKIISGTAVGLWNK